MTNTMLAGVFTGEGVFDLQYRPVPTLPDQDWVLIENEGCGVCGTDLHILSVPQGHPATPGSILGHEFVGRIVDAGSKVSQFKVGDRVTVAPNLVCGLCRQCKAGRSNHCENWTTLGIFQDGGFARYTTAPEKSLHCLSEDVPFEEIVWVEPLSCVVNGTDRLAIQPGQTAVVIGSGPIGILHGMMFKAAGAKVIISDLAPFRLDVSKQAGLDVTVDAKNENLAEVVNDVTHGLGAEVVVDAVGSQFGACIELAAKGGHISLFGINQNAQPAIQQYDITRNELTIHGSFVGANTFPRAIQILESGAIRPSVMNSLVLPLADVHQGIDAARRGEAVKVIVQA